jgi:hypothetical protein
MITIMTDRSVIHSATAAPRQGLISLAYSDGEVRATAIVVPLRLKSRTENECANTATALPQRVQNNALLAAFAVLTATNIKVAVASIRAATTRARIIGA